jgi:hypothetical protein
MKRRDFLGALILASAGVSGHSLGHAQTTAPSGLNYRHHPKVKANLALAADEEKLVKMLFQHSRQCCQFGGPVLSRLAGSNPPWVNLLVDTPNFSRLKTELFRFGVTPVSTPQFPTSFIKFHHGEQVYNLMNCGVEEFCQINRLKSRINLVPFAHSFVLYDLRRHEVYDPYGALQAPRPKGQPEMTLLSRPRNLPEALDCILTAKFDAKFLNFSMSEEIQDFERFVLASQCPDEDLPRVVERTVNYFPDALECLGPDEASALALSPLLKSAMQRALGVDLTKVWARVQRSSDDQGALFVALIKEGMGNARSATGFEDDLTLYLAKNGFVMRRTDLMMESLRVMG